VPAEYGEQHTWLKPHKSRSESTLVLIPLLSGRRSSSTTTWASRTRDSLPDGLTDQWANLAEASRDVSEGEGAYGDLETLYDEFLGEIGTRLAE